MKRRLLPIVAAVIVSSYSQHTKAQTDLAPGQNPNFAVSREHYMKIADSLNRWHSTTQHEMYKAIDWLAERKEARADRREFRRQLRLERARWYNGHFYNGGYYNRNFNYRYDHYRRGRSWGISPWYGLNFWL